MNLHLSDRIEILNRINWSRIIEIEFDRAKLLVILLFYKNVKKQIIVRIIFPMRSSYIPYKKKKRSFKIVRDVVLSYGFV